jgi:hypothetical protein
MFVITENIMKRPVFLFDLSLYYFKIQNYALIHSSTLYQQEYGHIQTCS